MLQKPTSNARAKTIQATSGSEPEGLIARRPAFDSAGALAVIAAATEVIPERLRTAAFAVSADLVLADGKIEPAERQFLNRLASELRLERRTRDELVQAMLVKNAA